MEWKKASFVRERNQNASQEWRQIIEKDNKTEKIYL